MFKERVKFFVRKLIMKLEGIVEKWLKFDQSAINFFVEVIDQFVLVAYSCKENVNFMQSRDILIGFLENWDQYLFFIEELHFNPIIS